MAAWGNIAKPKAASLGEIMLEQEYLLSDHAVAESLFSYEDAPPDLPTEAQLEYSDSDFALALALQEQFLSELQEP